MEKLCADVTNQIEEEESTTEEGLTSVTTRKYVWPISECEEALASSYFGCLPNEILMQLFRSLPVYDLINVGLVCRRFKMVADLEEVWKNKRRTLPNISLNAKWAQNGVTIAGRHQNSNASNNLLFPRGLYLHDDQTVLIADWGNHRVMKWKVGDTNGQVVAGGNGKGNRADQLNLPSDVIVDKETDSLIICDQENKRVMRWSRQSGTTKGETIIENIVCHGLTMDDKRFLYVCDYGKHEVRRYRVRETDGKVVASSNGIGHHINQLGWGAYVFVDRDHSVYVPDRENHCVMKWVKGAKEGVVVAGGQGQGDALTQLNDPRGVCVDSLGTVYVADRNNHRVMRWCNGNGSVIVGGNGRGGQENQLNEPEDLSFDRHGNLYVTDYLNGRIQRFSIETN